MSKKTKNLQQAGITLIALVVTLIILLILAGVTITLVIGENGLIGRAQSAYDTQTRAVIQQEIEQARGVAEIDRQTKNANYLSTIADYLNNDKTLKDIDQSAEAIPFSKSAESYVILTVGELYNCKITETGIEWLENAESAADLLRPEIVNLAEGDVTFSYSPSTPTQGNVIVTLTEKANLDKKGNTLSYKIGSGDWTPYTAPFEVNENCVILAGLYNGKEVGSTASGEVSNIDITAPTSCTFTIDETTTDSITVTATAVDSTGIKYFDFSTDGGSTYPAGNRYTIANPTSGSANKEFTFTGLTAATEYSIRVKATDEAGNSLQSSTQVQTTEEEVVAGLPVIKDTNGTPIDLATIASHYGEDVEYNTNTYQLFYVDTDGKYSGGTPGVWLQLKATAGNTSLDGSNTSSTLGILTDSADSALWEVNPSLKSKYQTTIRGIAEGSLNANIKGVAYLCDKTKWTDTYVASGDKTKGAFAIGGVSAEMFCDSYNQAKPSTAPTFGAKAFNANYTYGYYYIPSGTTASSYSKVDNGTRYGGYTDSSGNNAISTDTASGMYRYNTSTHPWLASPSARAANRVCNVYGASGFLDGNLVSIACAVRPAVFLPSSIPISLKN